MTAKIVLNQYPIRQKFITTRKTLHTKNKLPIHEIMRRVADLLIECRSTGRLSNHAWSSATYAIDLLNRSLADNDLGIDVSQISMINSMTSLKECIAGGLLGSHLESSAKSMITAIDQHIPSINPLRDYYHILIKERILDLEYEHHYILSAPSKINPNGSLDAIIENWTNNELIFDEVNEPLITIRSINIIPNFLVSQLSNKLTTLQYEDLMQIGILH